jgi:Lrp/AsnC family leucine-responsive transcriptional regulator
MDKIDINIIEELRKNAQMSFSRIAKEIGVSAKTVQKRYEKMKEERAIYRSTIAIDLSKIGYQGKAFLMITVAPNQDRKMTIEALNQTQNIIVFSEIMGSSDVFAVAAVRDLKSLVKLVSDIKKFPSVGQVEFALATDTAFPIDKDYNKLPLE